MKKFILLIALSALFYSAPGHTAKPRKAAEEELRGALSPEALAKARIAALEREARIAALEREARIAALEREARIAALEREARIAALEREARTA